MSICPNTGLTIPECACPRCVERQLEQFAPERLRVRAVPAAPPPSHHERSIARLPTVAERLTRPAL
jgi:hypothetical protein